MDFSPCPLPDVGRGIAVFAGDVWHEQPVVLPFLPGFHLSPSPFPGAGRGKAVLPFLPLMRVRGAIRL
jgi:hypothetical protein